MFAQVLFALSASLALGGALGVCLARNLMHACVLLLASLMGVAGLYATLGADFLAAVQLVVYAGGVVILMLFAVMLTGGLGRAANRFGLVKTPPMGNRRTRVVAALSALVAAATTGRLVWNAARGPSGDAGPYAPTAEGIGFLLVTDHVLVFEASSVLLLGVLVGAAVIARPRAS